MGHEARDREQAKRYRWLLRHMRRNDNHFESYKYTHRFTLTSNSANPNDAIGGAMFKEKVSK